MPIMYLVAENGDRLLTCSDCGHVILAGQQYVIVDGRVYYAPCWDA